MSTRSLLTIAIDSDASHSDNDIKSLISHIPDTHTLEFVETGADLTDFEWDTDDDMPSLPMSEDEAATLMNEEGYLTAVFVIDKNEFLKYHGYSSTDGADTHEDLAHTAVFDFGEPYDCWTEILAVQGDGFVISYTTCIGEFV